jgi:hypothetical protein
MIGGGVRRSLKACDENFVTFQEAFGPRVGVDRTLIRPMH